MLCIIPARGGSKRILRKNTRLFEGLPVIAYSIRAALASGLFEEVMVSTDDIEIADVARDYGASVPFMRSAETANDFATTADVIFEVLDRYEKVGRTFDSFCCLYATAPFVTPARLSQGAEIIRNGEANASFTCVAYSYPPQRGLEVNADGWIAMVHPQYAKTRSQDLKTIYHDAGQFYFSTVKAFRECGSLWGPDTRPVILEETEVQDLDTMTDWILAEMKFRLLRLPGSMEVAGYRLVPLQDAGSETNRKVLRGRNLPEVRSQMVHTGEISESEHRAFVDSLSLRSYKVYYAILDEKGDVVGCVNFATSAPGEVERGIWLMPEARGKGLSSMLLRKLYARLHDLHGIKSVRTFVRKENVPSNALEKSLGAVTVKTEGDFIHYVTNLE